MKRAAISGALALGMLLFAAPQADARPPIGFRVAAGTARVAARTTYAAARVPVRTAAIAGRATYRAAVTPIYAPRYASPVYRPYSPAFYPRPIAYPVYRAPVVRYGYGYGYGY